MRILLVGFTKIKYMPYMQFYLDNIDRSANDVSMLFWNRDLIEEDTSNLKGVKLYEFRYYQRDDINKLLKIKAFARYRLYAKKVISKGRFDFIIVVHSLPAILIMDILIKRYKNRYIFDYRDSTFENIEWFKHQVQKIQKNASKTFVSSDAYRAFFPSEEQLNILTTHNILLNSLEHRDEKVQNGTKSDRIRISFWGFIRHKEINIELINRIGHDNRFELHYYGREQEVAKILKKHVVDYKYENIFFHGEYSPEDRYEFVRNTDIIDNIYIDDDNLRLAMGNKYYDGIIFRIPQICNIGGSIMGRMVVKGGLGIECDPCNSQFCDIVYDYYTSLKLSHFYSRCDMELNRVLKEYQIVKEAVTNVGK